MVWDNVSFKNMLEALIGPLPLSHIKGERDFLSGNPEPKEREGNDLEIFDTRTLVEFYGMVAVGLIGIALARHNKNVRVTEQETILAQTSTS